MKKRRKKKEKKKKKKEKKAKYTNKCAKDETNKQINGKYITSNVNHENQLCKEEKIEERPLRNNSPQNPPQKPKPQPQYPGKNVH